MKKIILFVTGILFSFSFLQAQGLSNSLPDGTLIIPYKLEIGYNFNTAIAFPGTIKDAYWGFKEIKAQTVPQVQNVLLIKAAKQNFLPTNLHVFTADGKLYTFNVFYSDTPVQTTYDLRKLIPEAKPSTTGNVEFSDQAINENELAGFMDNARTLQPFLSKKSREYEMQIQLHGIYFYQDLLFFSLGLSNESNLDYNLDFTRLYIKDKRKSKRSSFQERELVPVKKDSLTRLAGHSTQNFVLVVPKFTIPDNKEFYLEVFEINGGRNLALKIKNHQLLKAKRL